MQNDFCPGGALAVARGDAIIPPINRIMDRFDLVVASRDMHPAESKHFKKWPVHCVAGTAGANFHPELEIHKVNCLIEKGTTLEDDGYSDFASTNLDLADYLHEQGIEELFVCGLATDYCVKATVVDSLRHGFKTMVLADCMCAVDVQPGDGAQAVREMQQHGAIIVTSKDLDP